MNGGIPGEYVVVPVDMVSWFSEKYNCCIVLPKWLAASLSVRLLRESTHMFISQLAVKGKRKICRMRMGTIIMYSIVTCVTQISPYTKAIRVALVKRSPHQCRNL